MGQRESVEMLQYGGAKRRGQKEHCPADVTEKYDLPETNTVFRVHVAPHGVCDNLINALQLLANQQTGGDSPIEMPVVKMMEKLRRFITDTHEAVEVGDVETTMELRPVVKPKFTAADELTLRRKEEGMLRTSIDTTNEGDNRWAPPLVDEDWYAICQAIFKGVEGANGIPCTTSTRSCTKRSTSRNQRQTRRLRFCGP